MKPRLTSLHVRPPLTVYWCVERIQGQIVARRSLTIPHDDVFSEHCVFVCDVNNPNHRFYVTDASRAAEPIDQARYEFWYVKNDVYYWFKGTRSRDMFENFVRNVNVRDVKPPTVVGRREQDTPSYLVRAREEQGDVEAVYMAVYLERQEGVRQTRLSLSNHLLQWNWETHWVFKARVLAYPRNWYSIDGPEDDALDGYTCYVSMGEDHCHFRRGNVASRFAGRFQLPQTIMPGPEFRPNR